MPVHDGHIVTVDALKKKACDAVLRQTQVTRTLDAIPTLAEITRSCATMRRRKAFGNDAIPPDIAANFPRQVADILAPLALKAALTTDEPLQWRGGAAAFFPKPGGKGKQCSSHREIILMDSFAKVYHKTLRRRLLSSIEPHTRPTQMGGIAKRSTDFAALLLRARMDALWAAKPLQQLFLWMWKQLSTRFEDSY